MSQSVLDTNVLVLNRFYMAIRVINVRRTFTLLYRDCAEVIDTEIEPLLQEYWFDAPDQARDAAQALRAGL